MPPRSIVFLLLAAPLGCDHTAKTAFMSDNNRCFADVSSTSVSLVDPDNIALALTDEVTPTHAQSLTAAATMDIFGFKLRLIGTNLEPTIDIDLVKQLPSGATAAIGETLTLPNGMPGEYMGRGTMITPELSDALKWADFRMREPLTIDQGTTYWLRVYPLESGVSWTIAEGAGYASYSNGSWDVIVTRGGAYQIIECAEDEVSE